MHYIALVPCVVSALTAFGVAKAFSIVPVHFDGLLLQEISLDAVIKVVVLAVLCALVSSLFCISIKKCEHYIKKCFANRYLKAFAGGVIIVVLTIVLRTTDYNGAGMGVITNAISGNARYEAFILKILFTAITIAAGFKGGEIVPSFFIGATFGCVAGNLLGLDAGFAAALGLSAVFCGVVNCPVASVMLSLELFGSDNIVLFALVCAISYMMSGYFGLYKSQRIAFSKLGEDYVDVNTR
jgi:H+/Cl- antiporter ClcA